MRKPPAFQVYPKDYESDEAVKLMTLEQEGAYWRLLLHQWINGSVPDNVAHLALICRITPKRMAALWSGVACCFREAGAGRLSNPRLERQRAEQEAFQEERAASGQKGASRRWGKAQPDLDYGSANGSATVEPIANDGSPSATASPSPQTDLQTKPASAGSAAAVARVFEHWRSVMGHADAKLTAKRRRYVEQRLGEGYTEHQLTEAIDGCKASPFHQGQNDRGKVYDDLELICRDGGHVERFQRELREPQRRPASNGKSQAREDAMRFGIMASLKGDGTVPMGDGDDGQGLAGRNGDPGSLHTLSGFLPQGHGDPESSVSGGPGSPGGRPLDVRSERVPAEDVVPERGGLARGRG